MAFVVSKVSASDFTAAIAVMRHDFEKYLASTASQFDVLNSMAAVVEEHGESDQFFIGTDSEGTVSLLVISGGMSKKIDELVAKKGYGGRTVEFAMNVCNGRASLESFDAASTSLWGKVGFVKFAELPAQQAQGGCMMRLICSSSEKWSDESGPWKLIRPKEVPQLVPEIQPRAPQPYRGLGVGQREDIRG